MFLDVISREVSFIQKAKNAGNVTWSLKEQKPQHLYWELYKGPNWMIAIRNISPRRGYNTYRVVVHIKDNLKRAIFECKTISIIIRELRHIGYAFF